MKIGTDIIEISRIENALKIHNFMQRTFTIDEIAYAISKTSAIQHFAGFFCAKEATVKALGGGLISELEIRHNQDGSPYIVCSGSAEKLRQGKKIIISISHSHSVANAVAILQEE